MAENKTQQTGESVDAFLDSIEPPARRNESKDVCSMMQKLSGEPPRMWGASIVGFGRYHYRYETGREGDWMRVGFSPRKAALTLYIMGGFPRHEELMKKLGPHKTGSSCLYLKKLSDVDPK
ncbi:MAG TPA: DUF1801 domain-containing protein, partial [Thermoanaerobaculia bacterium]|nr:DUF1801 domain-containing protein [Thermoanaerobaculia bacterium]